MPRNPPAHKPLGLICLATCDRGSSHLLSGLGTAVPSGSRGFGGDERSGPGLLYDTRSFERGREGIRCLLSISRSAGCPNWLELREDQRPRVSRHDLGLRMSLCCRSELCAGDLKAMVGRDARGTLERCAPYPSLRVPNPLPLSPQRLTWRCFSDANGDREPTELDEQLCCCCFNRAPVSCPPSQPC